MEKKIINLKLSKGRVLSLKGYYYGDYHSTFHLSLYEDIIKTED